MSGAVRRAGEDGGPLLAWYDANRRDLPWRRTSDPYAVWVSEVMLQQTQAATVAPYFERWMGRFPSVESLALADAQEALALWQGLGYYRRCRLLLAGARWIVTEGMPDSHDGWLNVPGVGRYTAAAIASIAFGAPEALVDGNVERVYARVAASRSTGNELLKEARAWAKDQLFAARPGDWNQALMELGATVCTPRGPKCPECPIRKSCIANLSWEVEAFPVPSPKPTIVQERHLAWVPWFEGRVGVRMVPEGGWWEGLWEFPRVVLEAPQFASDGESAALRELAGEGWLETLGTVRHSVTNHRIRIEGWLLRCQAASEALRWMRPDELPAIPMPSPQRRLARLAWTRMGV